MCYLYNNHDPFFAPYFVLTYIKKYVMRTTLDLPDDLLNRAMEISGAKTKSQLVKEALEDLINRRQRLKLLTFKGKIDLNVNLDELRERK